MASQQKWNLKYFRFNPQLKDGGYWCNETVEGTHKDAEKRFQTIQEHTVYGSVGCLEITEVETEYTKNRDSHIQKAIQEEQNKLESVFAKHSALFD